ncbi:MAG: NAD(P)/FAD-dependent oxidoreductase [Deltaproteobacteria bacterium]|jgi:dihydrolipoamide dehydrogenase|nr:NAD(P)/FAD-dependent oxidoreductase [Deltaproteobacteria bacterium]
MNYDLVVIGSGPGGVQAAFAAREQGLGVLLVESCFLGGTCVNVGCIPTKFLLGGTATKSMLDAQKKLRCLKGEVEYDLPAIQERKDRYIKALRGALEKRLTAAGVEILPGRASFSAPNSLSVKAKEGPVRDITFKHCVIAVGSKPAVYPGLEPDGAHVLSSSGLLNLNAAPESLIIVGGGVIGLELGDFYASLGSRITLVEVMDRIALSEDAEVSAAMSKQLTREGWKIYTGRKVTQVNSDNGEAVLRFEDGEELRAAKAMIAVGRHPATDSLKLEAAGIKTAGPGWVQTDDYLLAAPNVYAVGDCNRRALLAHAAEHQADYVIRHLLGKEKAAYDSGPMPSCIYGSNEVMHVGPHAQDLAAKYKPLGKSVAVSYSNLISNTIAQSYGATQGWVKVTWVDGEVHSVAAWGHGASRFLAASTIMVQQRWAANQIIFAHPTLDESLKSALLAPKEVL